MGKVLKAVIGAIFLIVCFAYTILPDPIIGPVDDLILWGIYIVVNHKLGNSPVKLLSQTH